jgi:hypothetical protein
MCKGGNAVSAAKSFVCVRKSMAYSMVKACKLEPCHMKAREAAKFPILLPGKSQSREKLRVELRHLAFDIAFSLEWLGSHVVFQVFYYFH